MKPIDHFMISPPSPLMAASSIRRVPAEGIPDRVGRDIYGNKIIRRLSATPGALS
jgi:hypothetical protein